MKKIFITLLMISSQASAEMDAASQQALKQTQDLIRNKSQREEEIKKDPEYQKMDQKLDGFSNNSANKEMIYSIAADVIKNLAEKNNGDPEAMKKILLEAESNPEKFMNDYFSESQKNAVRAVASEIEKKQKNVPASPTK